MAAGQIVVRAVAKRPRAGVFAAAEDHILIGFGFEQNRRESGARMRAVAERLIGRASAGAPEVALAGFDFVVEAFALSNLRSLHGNRGPSHQN